MCMELMLNVPRLFVFVFRERSNLRAKSNFLADDVMFLIKFFPVVLLSITQRIVPISANFKLEKHWPHESVSNLKFFGSAIALDNDGNLLLLHRSNQTASNSKELILEDTVLILDRSSGKILRTWGNNKFVKPHGIELMQNGDIFITDVSLHQVFKFEFNSSTKVWNEDAILTLGEKFVSGNDAYHFCGPADVAVMPGSNEFFVADGYCNCRVVKFDKFGKFLLEFGAGSPHFEISPTPFNVTHSITLVFSETVSNFDISTTLSSNTNATSGSYNIPNSADVLVFVADRNNGRIQCFTTTGTFRYEIGYENFGKNKAMLLSIAYIRNPPTLYRNYSSRSFGIIYAINGHMSLGQPSVFELAVSSSYSNLISSFKISKVIDAQKDAEKLVETPHDIAVSKDGRNIFIVEASVNLTLKKFSLNLLESKGVIHFSKSFVVIIIIIIISYYIL